MENDIDVGVYDFTAVDCRKVYERYLEWIMELARNYDYDVIGHITYPLRYMAKMGIFLNVNDYEEQVRELYRCIIDKNKGIELNASGLYQEINETMPSFPMLKWYHECSGEILTIGSDSHYEKHVGLPIVQGMELIKQAGFRYITTFEKREAIFHKI